MKRCEWSNMFDHAPTELSICGVFDESRLSCSRSWGIQEQHDSHLFPGKNNDPTPLSPLFDIASSRSVAAPGRSLRPHPSFLFDQTSMLDSAQVGGISQVLTELRGNLRTERAQLIDDSYWVMRRIDSAVDCSPS